MTVSFKPVKVSRDFDSFTERGRMRRNVCYAGPSLDQPQTNRVRTLIIK